MKITVLYRHNQKDIGAYIFIRNKYGKFSNYSSFKQDKKAATKWTKNIRWKELWIKY